MALTTYTNRTLPVGFTQQQLYDEIKAAMQVAGFAAPIDENGTAGSTMEQVYSWTYNASTKGTVFLRIQIPTTLTITQTLFDTYNTTTNTGTNGSILGHSFTTPISALLSVLTLNNLEMRGIAFRSGASDLGFIGLIRPETKPVEWDENQWPYAFLTTSSIGSFGRVASALLPSTASGSTSPTAGVSTIALTQVNTLTGKPDIFPFGIFVVYNSNNGGNYGGKFSPDLAFVQGVGRMQGDTFDNKWIYIGRNQCLRYAN